MQLLIAAASAFGLIAYFAGSVLTILGLRNAPEGYEDENGFHALEGQSATDCAELGCSGADTAVPF